jgi:hypothetical protein
MTIRYREVLSDALWLLAPYTLPIIVILVMLFG